MRFSKLSKCFGPILGARFQVPFRIYSERSRQAIRIAVSDLKKFWDFLETAPLIADQLQLILVVWFVLIQRETIVLEMHWE